MINEKKQRDTIEWERLEVSSKKIRDIKKIFHTKMGKIKDRNGMHLTETEDIKKRCKNTQKMYIKNILMTQITTML